MASDRKICKVCGAKHQVYYMYLVEVKMKSGFVVSSYYVCHQHNNSLELSVTH